MSGFGRHRMLDVFPALLVACSFVSLLPGGLAYPTDDNFLGDAEPLFYPMPETSNHQDMDIPHPGYIQKPKSCFHFYVSRNMSSLLSEATKMLQQVRDRHEREWILTFIYRIKSLAEHLRTHPESRNYDCLPGEDEDRQRVDHMRIPQPELYFEDDLIPQKRNSDRSDSEDKQEDPSDDQEATPDNQGSQSPSTSNTSPEKVDTPKSDGGPGSTTSSVPSSEKDSVSPPPSHSSSDGIVLSSPPDCEANRACERALNRQIAEGVLSKDGSTITQDNDDQLVQQVSSTTQHQLNMEEDRRQQKVLKKRIRKALLEEMAPEVKKLRTVGGTEEDLINLWKQSEATDTSNPSQKPHYNDFDYEEIGAAAGDLNSDRFTTNDHTVAPSLGDMKNFKRQSSSEGGTKAYEPYDDSDVLVKQLFDIRFEPAPQKTTTSVNSDRKEEYLITSTHIPY